MELPLEELQQLERLLLKAADVGTRDCPFYGHIDTVWQGDQIVRIDKHDQRKIDRGKR